MEIKTWNKSSICWCSATFSRVYGRTLFNEWSWKFNVFTNDFAASRENINFHDRTHEIKFRLYTEINKCPLCTYVASLLNSNTLTRRYIKLYSWADVVHGPLWHVKWGLSNNYRKTRNINELARGLIYAKFICILHHLDTVYKSNFVRQSHNSPPKNSGFHN